MLQWPSGSCYNCPPGHVTMALPVMLRWPSRSCYNGPPGQVTIALPVMLQLPSGSCYNCPLGHVTIALPVMLQLPSQSCYNCPPAVSPVLTYCLTCDHWLGRTTSTDCLAYCNRGLRRVMVGQVLLTGFLVEAEFLDHITIVLVPVCDLMYTSH